MAGLSLVLLDPLPQLTLLTARRTPNRLDQFETWCSQGRFGKGVPVDASTLQRGHVFLFMVFRIDYKQNDMGDAGW